MAKTILVVDDTASLRKMVKSYLSQEGFDVVTAADGSEALMVARQAQPELAVSSSRVQFAAKGRYALTSVCKRNVSCCRAKT